MSNHNIPKEWHLHDGYESSACGTIKCAIDKITTDPKKVTCKNCLRAIRLNRKYSRCKYCGNKMEIRTDGQTMHLQCNIKHTRALSELTQQESM